MIRLNAATELCIAKGQEGTVHSWVEGIGNRGQRVLETLFVRLSSPPKDVKFDNLPPNVVPLTRTSSAILCSLPDDSSISINRSQVEIIPNFSMTDYCSQGKTRLKNPVDLMNCRSHQSYYTALSRSATADGTLLLPDFTDPRRPAFDPRKIQGGCSGHLRQEFRELELLDHVTSMLYENELPSTVFGERRYDLLTRFQYHVGEAFVPPAVEPSIAWGPYDPVHPTSCSEFEWDVKSMPHVPVSTDRVEHDDLRPTGPHHSLLSMHAESVSTDKHFVNAQCNISGFHVEHNLAGSEQGVSPRPVSPIHRPTKRKSSSYATQDPSLSSTDYSLGDSIAPVPTNTWKSDPARYAECFEGINVEWMGELSRSLQMHIEGKYSLEQRVRLWEGNKPRGNNREMVYNFDPVHDDTSGQLGAGDRSGSPAGADASGIGVPSLDDTEQWGTGSFEGGGTWGSSGQNVEELRLETIAEADDVSAEDTVVQVM
ncbi:hypothetical protein F5146DRAFT_1130516 [Armillaria mellea]|nr:hypothetical protein F5146DRAFT_1130516 [Armillaria mellea]